MVVIRAVVIRAVASRYWLLPETMGDSLPIPPEGANDILHRLEHDLCGPLITARGFLDEIIEVRAELNQWMIDNREPLATLGGGAMERLLEDELDVCVTYLEQALTQLDQRIVTLARTLAETQATDKQG